MCATCTGARHDSMPLPSGLTCSSAGAQWLTANKRRVSPHLRKPGVRPRTTRWVTEKAHVSANKTWADGVMFARQRRAKSRSSRARTMRSTTRAPYWAAHESHVSASRRAARWQHWQRPIRVTELALPYSQSSGQGTECAPLRATHDPAHPFRLGPPGRGRATRPARRTSRHYRVAHTSRARL